MRAGVNVQEISYIRKAVEAGGDVDCKAFADQFGVPEEVVQSYIDHFKGANKPAEVKAQEKEDDGSDVIRPVTRGRKSG